MNYRKLFKEHKVIRDLSLVQFISYFGAWFSNVAIYTMLVNFGSSALAISVVTAMHFLPAVLIAPFSGAIIDRFKIKPLMLFLLLVEFIMTLSFLLIDSKEELWLLLIFIFIRMSSASMFFSTEMSLLAKLVKGAALQKANEIHSIIWSFCYAFGMAVSGVVVNYIGAKPAIVIDSLFFLTAIVVFAKINFVVKESEIKDRFFTIIKDGFIYIKNNRILLHLILLHASVGLTSFDALVTLLAKNEYKYIIAVPLSIGISNAIRAFALMIGPYFLGRFANRENFFYILIFQGIGIALWASLQFDFYYALIGLFFTGFFTTVIWSYTYALLQEKCEERYLGRVISYNDMIFMLSNVATTIFIGLMASLTSLDIITYIISFGFIIVAFYYKKVLQWL
ncbi:MFS transporter [Malaciobacter halophilus]|uniref:MFS transporter n=1 Tax=Malaciobacter halophilus TaxID=197482 RepID=A0A2N1J024_9BACT|nr:MFS transporter [Malaciobacter halophilus]AXH10465.1 proton antiporter protein, major facilitator superfamily [Malaciobacter halophilus]PKI79897.1 MFS transporter [Malaciobacter halophilus]